MDNVTRDELEHKRDVANDELDNEGSPMNFWISVIDDIDNALAEKSLSGHVLAIGELELMLDTYPVADANRIVCDIHRDNPDWYERDNPDSQYSGKRPKTMAIDGVKIIRPY